MDDEYTSIFLELFMYVPYLEDEKAKVQRFINWMPLKFKYCIEYDEPRSLEEAIRKMKRCYEQSKQKPEFKHDQKGNEKSKRKWPERWGRSQDVGEKEIVAPHNKFNAAERGNGS